MFPRLLLFTLLAFACVLPASRGQPDPADPERGHPPIRNWTMRDYGAYAQTWVARRDAEGRLYFGNRDNVLMYDGQTWKKLPVPGVFIRGLDFAADGTLYVGGVDQLGYFKRNALGEWGEFVSLRDKIPPAERDFREVWDVFTLPHGVYFACEKRLFRWRDGAIRTWRLDHEFNTFSYAARGELYLGRRSSPLRHVVGDDLVDVPAPTQIGQGRTTGVLAWENDALLIAWEREGLAVLRNGVLTPWAPEWTDWFREHGIGWLSRADDSTIAVMTLRDGVLLFDAAGKLVQRIDVSSGLYNPIVRDVVPDAEGGLWFAMNHGVAYVDALSPFTLFDTQNGLGRSTARAITRQNGTVYVATAEGVFRLIPASGSRMAHFEPVPGVTGSPTSLEAHASGLIIGSSEGIFILPSDGSAPYHVTTGGAWQILTSRGDPNWIWVTGSTGVYSCRFDGTRWQAGQQLAGPYVETRRVVERPDGSLWASTTTRDLLRWAAPRARPQEQPEAIGSDAGIPPGQTMIRLVNWNGRLHASFNSGIFVWSDEKRRFEKLAIDGATPTDGAFNLYGGDPAHLWTFYGPKRDRARITRIHASGKRESLPHHLTAALGDVEYLWSEHTNGRDILWVGGSYGLARVDLGKPMTSPSDFVALFGGVGRSLDPVVRDGVYVWPHGKADLDIQFSATTYRSDSSLLFQTWLEGYDRDWNPWSPTPHRSFTNLSAGSYTLHLRAQDADGRQGRPATLRFEVLPPWWQTPWAYALYVGAAAFFVHGVVRWRVRVSERERERLQQLVAERTCQLAESQKDLLHAKDAAEAANRAKSAFLASMSHELRTPLNSVLGYAQILRRSPEMGATARRALETIQRSGDHLLHLINEVLDLAKVESGKIELLKEPFPLGRFAQSMTELFSVRAAEKQLEFSGPDVSLFRETVSGDEARLRQVVVNLLGNAFKFTERGRVSWSITKTAQDSWRFEVVDSGIGISAAEQARIFDPFYQSSARPHLARQGTGLGLAISAHLVELMGGRLQLESTPGQGSRFWFEIRLPVIAAASAGPEPVANDAALMVGYRGPRRRLLVVDDEKSNRAILDEMLAPLGFEIEEAESADRARAAISRQPPDAVLLDLRMPGDDGFVLAREWRANGALRGAKVLALSASVLPEQQAEAIAAGCDAFMAKPFRDEQLFRVLGSLLQLDWLYSAGPDSAPGAESAQASGATPPEIRWEEGVLQRLLQLAERGDALRLGDELSSLARRSAAWAAAVNPWQKLAGGYQMEALSRALEETLRAARGAST